MNPSAVLYALLILLQAGSVSAGLVNAAVIVLIVVFLTLPTVFILAEHLRKRRASPAAEPAVAPAESPTVPTVDSSSVAHDFTREPVPRELGYLAPARRIEGNLGFMGHLQVGPRCAIVGDVEVTGSLALGDGAYASRNVRATGNVYLGRGARVGGTVTAGGRVFLVSLAQAEAVRASGAVELEEGAQVSGVIDAPEVQHVDRIHDPLVRARQGQAAQASVVPTI